MESLNYTFIKRQKPVLLLIHGFLGSMQQWSYIEEELSNTNSILKIELPGHGDSPEFSNNYSLNELVLQIDQILENEKIDQLNIVGHSMGGYLGAAFAKARPEKTLSLTMLNSIAGKDPEERKILRNRSIKLIEKYQEAYVNMAIANLFTKKERELYKSRIEIMIAQAHDISIKSIIQALICMRDRKSSLSGIKKLKFPLCYIYGFNDLIIPSDSIVRECEFLKIEGKGIESGHMTLLTNTEDILKYMHFVE